MTEARSPLRRSAGWIVALWRSGGLFDACQTVLVLLVHALGQQHMRRTELESRADEIVGLRWSDVDLKDERILLPPHCPGGVQASALLVDRQKSVTAKMALIATVADQYRKIYNSKIESAVKIGEVVQSMRKQLAGMPLVPRHRLVASVVDNRKAARRERMVALSASEGR